MKISLMGRGKTGGQLLELVPKESLVAVFDSSTPLDIDKIDSSDVGIVFLPGESFISLLPQLLNTTAPLIIGSTGFEWRPEHLQQLEREKKRWVHGHNFSLAMNVVRNLLNLLGRSQKLLGEMEFLLHEVHHEKKQDAPSGTALKWQQWLGIDPVKITHERSGDAIGTHQLTVSGPMEKLQLSHEALDRKIFACGALWAAQKVLGDPSLPFGVIAFEDLVDRYIGDKNS